MSALSDFKSSPFDLFTTSTDASNATLTGVRFADKDGREFSLVQNGATALVAGNLIQGPAQVANHQNLVVVSYTAPTNNTAAQVVATLAGTAMTAARYSDGYLIVNSGIGIGQTLKIATVSAQTSTTGNVTITLEDTPLVALTTASKVSLRLNPYGSSNGTAVTTDGVVICPTTLTGQVIGVTLYAIAASTATVPTYGFIQTRGLVACLNDATTAIGLDLMPSTNTAGAVMTYVVATSSRVGTSTQAGVTTEARQINIQL